MSIGDFGDISERLRRSTVLVRAGDRGSGSGVIWQRDGLIVTNAHVALGARTRVQLWDGREFYAAVISRDPRADLAALRTDAAEAQDLPAAQAADSSQLRPGELAIAIGNPLGFVGALTTGVIHGIGPLRAFGPRHWVQASVRLAPGNSGGPLADARGHVIGINTMVAGRLALAIPSNAVRQFLLEGPGAAWLGVTLRPVRVPRRGGNAFGLVILEVEPHSPAGRASLLPGDILWGTEGRAFRSLDDLAHALAATAPHVLRLEFLRGDYAHLRRVSVQLSAGAAARSSVAA